MALHPIPLAQVDGRVIEALAALVAMEGVLVMPGQGLDDHAFRDFLSRLGRLVFTTGETPVEGCEDLNVVTNMGRERPPRSVFHTDSSYFTMPPSHTALRAVEVPASGGETLFTNQYVAWRSLPAPLRARLGPARMRHRVSGLNLGDGDEKEAVHPLVRRHPRTGMPALYLSTPERCTLLDDDGRAVEDPRLVSALYRWSTRRQNILRHTWRAGDVVLWDNRCTMHRADHSAVSGARTFHRGMVRDHLPV